MSAEENRKNKPAEQAQGRAEEAQAPAAGQSILSYSPSSEGAEAYRQLTKEVLNEKS